MKLRNWILLTASIVFSLLGLARVLDAKPVTRLTANDTVLAASTPASAPVVSAKLIAANTRLSFKLFSEILKKQPNENIFISPASVAIALAMTYNGASGSTQQEIAQTLELQGMNLQEINQANASLKASLENPDPKVQISIANSLWAAESQPFKTEFTQKIQGFYKAEFQNLNFGAPTAPSIINAWVKRTTNQKIKEIVDKNEIGADTVFILINAIYFKGNWTNAFSLDSTELHPFTLLNGTQKQHPTMFQELPGIGYCQNEMFQAVELPYGEGRLSMYLFLPNKGISLKAFYESLNAENWEKWMNQFNTYNNGDRSEAVFIGLPRFKLEYSIELKDILKALGMEIAFTGGADFSGISPSRLWIDKVKHKTFLEVNEEGTEAAGTTGVASTRGGRQMIIFDRPFFFVIRDKQTGTILFMGSLLEPK